MAEVIDIGAARAKREPQPDPEHVFVDERGGKWFEFTCTFDADDTSFGFTIWAKDFPDAERRIGLLRQTARVDGQLYSVIPNT